MSDWPTTVYPIPNAHPLPSQTAAPQPGARVEQDTKAVYNFPGMSIDAIYWSTPQGRRQ